MRIVNYKSGLGNQLFYYLFTLYLEKKYPNEKIYGYYNKKFLKKHNGLEIQKVFDVKLPKDTWKSNLVAWLCRKLNGIGIPYLKASDNSLGDIYIYYDGWWQDRRFYLDNLKEIKFKKIQLDEQNSLILNKIRNSFSVSIHIRRGDYMLPQFINQYGNIATIDYYRKAIDIATSQNRGNLFFFVFSDDMEWTKANLALNDAIYVTNNKGEDSFKDMYLMSFCNVNILANSTFSYWGAMLNKNPQRTVIYPAKWNNYKTPDIFPNDWISL